MLSPACSRYSTLSMVSRSVPRSIARYSLASRARRREFARVHAGRDGGTHQLEFDAREDGRQNAAFPTRRIESGVLLPSAEEGHARRALFAEQPRDARVKPGGDAVEHEDGGRLPATLDRGEHAPTHAAPRFKVLQGQLSPGALLADALTEPRQIEAA